MTLNEARLIREIKKSCTYRRLAEVYYPEEHRGHGNQFYGEELCKDALETMYPGKDIWMQGAKKESEQFCVENKSYVGEFFWWE